MTAAVTQIKIQDAPTIELLNRIAREDGVGNITDVARRLIRDGKRWRDATTPKIRSELVVKEQTHGNPRKEQATASVQK